MNQFDAILIHIGSATSTIFDFLPENRNPMARYIAYLEKMDFFKLREINQYQFNWTVSYLSNSELKMSPATFIQNNNKEKVWKWHFCYLFKKICSTLTPIFSWTTVLREKFRLILETSWYKLSNEISTLSLARELVEIFKEDSEVFKV